MGILMGFSSDPVVKNPPAMQEHRLNPWVGKIPWGKEVATHSSILAWKISIHGVAKDSDQATKQQQSPGLSCPKGIWLSNYGHQLARET